MVSLMGLSLSKRSSRDALMRRNSQATIRTSKPIPAPISHIMFSFSHEPDAFSGAARDAGELDALLAESEASRAEAEPEAPESAPEPTAADEPADAPPAEPAPGAASDPAAASPPAEEALSADGPDVEEAVP